MNWNREDGRRQRATRDGLSFLIGPANMNGRFIAFVWRSDGGSVNDAFASANFDRVSDAKAWAASWDFDEWRNRGIAAEQARRDEFIRQMNNANRRIDNLIAMERPS